MMKELVNVGTTGFQTNEGINIFEGILGAPNSLYDALVVSMGEVREFSINFAQWLWNDATTQQVLLVIAGFVFLEYVGCVMFRRTLPRAWRMMKTTWAWFKKTAPAMKKTIKCVVKERKVIGKYTIKSIREFFIGRTQQQ